MSKFFSFVSRHAKLVILLILVITIFFAYNALSVALNASFDAFLPWGERSASYIGGLEGQSPDIGISDKASETAIAKAEKLLASASVNSPVVEYNTNESTIDVESIKRVDVDNSADQNYNASYLVFVGGEKLYTKDSLNLVEACFSQLEAMNDVGTPASVLDYFTLTGTNGRIGFEKISPDDDHIWSDEEAEELEKRINADPIIKNYLVSGDKKGMLFTFPVHDNGAAQLERFEEILAPLEAYGLSVFINGGPAINVKIMQYLIRDLSLLMTLCIIAILVVYYFSFRSKRSVLIPGSLSLIGLIWTFGAMSLMDIDITILNIVTPCMVITLGSAYAIHVLNEYYLNFSSGMNDVNKIIVSSSRIIKTIFLAGITTVAGFLCLCISETDGLKEFGISVSVGIVFCAILACTYLPAVMSITPLPKRKQARLYKEGMMTKFINKFSLIVVRAWKIFLILFIVLFVIFLAVKDEISVNSNYMSYFPKSDKFGADSKSFAMAMGGTNPYEITITAPEGSDKFFMNIENLNKVREYEESLLASPDILQSISITNYLCFANSIVGGEYEIPDNMGIINMLSRMLMIMRSQGNSDINRIVSEDFNSITLIVQHWDAVEQDLMTTSSIIRTYNTIVKNLGILPEGTTVRVVGDPLVNVKFANRLLQDQNRSTILSILIVLLITVITFASLEKGIETIFPVLGGIMINYVFMYVAGIPFDIVTVSFSSIAVGCGVDDAIHFGIRYKNKQKEMNDTAAALSSTLRETARPIILTTLSIVFGMMMLSFASYTPIRYFGLLMSVTLFGCMFSTIVFLPPFILLIDVIKHRFGKIFHRV